MAKKEKEMKKVKNTPVRKLKGKPNAQISTQAHLPFVEIRDGLVLMKDGTLRAILLVSSVNFALKSEDEQKGIVQGYVSFLNTIDFELQIVVQSRKLNIEKYLTKLDGLARQQENELLRKQTMSYRSFIEKMVVDAEIMDKKFFVVVPYSPYSKKKKSFWSRFQEVLAPAKKIRLSQAQFEKYKIEVDRRVGSVNAGLKGIGLQVAMLDTQALIELYYNAYNPITKQQKRVEDIDKMQVDQTIVD